MGHMTCFKNPHAPVYNEIIASAKPSASFLTLQTSQQLQKALLPPNLPPTF